MGAQGPGAVGDSELRIGRFRIVRFESCDSKIAVKVALNIDKLQF